MTTHLSLLAGKTFVGKGYARTIESVHAGRVYYVAHGNGHRVTSSIPVKYFNKWLTGATEVSYES